MRRPLVLLLFLLSGAAGLIYQVVWMRELTLILGVTSQAVATVLAVFMGGLALGAWLLGRAGDEMRSPLLFYGWLELGIALFGAQSLLLLDGLAGLYVELRRAGVLSDGALSLVRVALAGLALIGPTTLMGATLPVLVKGVCRSRERVARDAGLLYGVNTLGAVLGVLVTAFFLIERFGLRVTTAVAVGTNVVVGLLALVLSRGERGLVPERETDAVAPEEVSTREPALARLVLAAFAASGFLALAYEVLWTRYLVYVVGENSVYAFSTMLASFLIGIALGSFLAALVADRVRDRVALFGGVLVLVGAAAVSTVSLMGLLARASELVEPGGFWSESALRFLQCLGVLIVPTTLSGATFAIVARIYAQERSTLGRDAGRAYAANTLGAIFGALAGGFLVLPRLGLERGLIALAGVQVLVGLAVLLFPRAQGRAIRTALATGLVAVAAFASLRWAEDPRDLLERDSGGVLEYYADGPEASIAVLRDPGTGNYSLVVDGDGQAGTELPMQIHLRLLGHLPALFHPAPRKALVVGFGAGIAVGCLAQHALERVDVVELSDAVLAPGASGLFAPFNHDPLHDPLVRAIRDDGRNWLLATDEVYDVITSDPIDPDDAGVTSLYSREYFELVRTRLSPGGVACQWMSTRYAPDDYRMLVRTFQSVFPYTSIWYADYTTVVVGTATPPRVELSDLRARLALDSVRASLAVVGIDDVEGLLSLCLAGPEQVRELVGAGPINTDDRPRIEYRGPRGDGPQRGGDDSLWRALVAARAAGPRGCFSAWSEPDEAVWRASRVHADPLYERHVLEVGLPRPRRPAGGVLAAPDAPGSVARERALRYLELTWGLLAAPTPVIQRILVGLERPEPPHDADAGQRARYAESFAAGLAAWDAGELEPARASFEAAADAIHQPLRAALLSAACRQRAGDPLAALEELLRLDWSGVDWWSPLRELPAHLVDQVLWTMEDAEGDAAAALGARLLELTPRDRERPRAPRHRAPGPALEARPRKPQPEAAGSVDAWRRWWHDAAADVQAHAGRFVWLY